MWKWLSLVRHWHWASTTCWRLVILGESTSLAWNGWRSRKKTEVCLRHGFWIFGPSNSTLSGSLLQPKPPVLGWFSAYEQGFIFRYVIARLPTGAVAICILKASVLHQIPIYSEHLENRLPRRAYALLAMTWLFGSLYLYWQWGFGRKQTVR